jgi:hypothetical protein
MLAALSANFPAFSRAIPPRKHNTLAGCFQPTPICRVSAGFSRGLIFEDYGISGRFNMSAQIQAKASTVSYHYRRSFHELRSPRGMKITLSSTAQKFQFRSFSGAEMKQTRIASMPEVMKTNDN